MKRLQSLAIPKSLAPGDTVAVVSPSWGGAARFPYRLDAGLKILRDRFGFVIRETPGMRADPDWLAANPQARAGDLMAAFADPEVNGIVAAIGGDDAVRLEPFLRLDVIAANPKVMLGYSDTTALHFACLKAGLRSYYGPSVMSGFAENGGISPTTERGFRAAVMSAEPFNLLWAAEGWTDEHLDWSARELQSRHRRRTHSTGPRVLRGQGQHAGPLIGGCLEVLEMLKATP
ncbi:S66 peptidase family protein [Brevundimonas sp.]|uniref:S66 family peptidase n=1 Tax=Brevundimonas sp. TaxID=1871086 RepID=UPI0035657DEC